MSAVADCSTYPVALLKDVQRHTLARARLCATDLVLWQSTSGAVQVWEDRCPHRSIRLSAGRNLGDCVQCGYHGWTFDTQGAVRDVPGKIEGQENGTGSAVRVKTVNSVVAHDIIWACVDGDAVSPRGFTPGNTDILLRPVSVDAPADVLRKACAAYDDMVLVVAPCDERTSMIYGYTGRIPNTSELDVLRSCNHRLNALRRNVEEGAQP